MRDDTSPLTRCSKTASMADKDCNPMSASTLPSTAIARASADSCRLLTKEPRAVMQMRRQGATALALGPGRKVFGTGMAPIRRDACRGRRYRKPVHRASDLFIEHAGHAQVHLSGPAAHEPAQRLRQRQAGMSGTALCTSRAGAKRRSISAASQACHPTHRSGVHRSVASRLPIDRSNTSNRARGVSCNKSSSPGESSSLTASTQHSTRRPLRPSPALRRRLPCPR